jgi:hypothetical protein
MRQQPKSPGGRTTETKLIVIMGSSNTHLIDWLLI